VISGKPWGVKNCWDGSQRVTAHWFATNFVHRFLDRLRGTWTSTCPGGKPSRFRGRIFYDGRRVCTATQRGPAHQYALACVVRWWASALFRESAGFKTAGRVAEMAGLRWRRRAAGLPSSKGQRLEMTILEAARRAAPLRVFISIHGVISPADDDDGRPRVGWAIAHRHDRRGHRVVVNRAPLFPAFRLNCFSTFVVVRG